ncbi:unnamed protein product [Moneuplotes crassus]|uniref:RING-type E3 ubiquitin transferase n=1 Tax=Euplotes crassus TaxID=5936 RepID=A0AAD2D1A0_EUPCR|nr:unnamed protein product [Moneuplotes crassus]
MDKSEISEKEKPKLIIDLKAEEWGPGIVLMKLSELLPYVPGASQYTDTISLNTDIRITKNNIYVQDIVDPKLKKTLGILHSMGMFKKFIKRSFSVGKREAQKKSVKTQAPSPEHQGKQPCLNFLVCRCELGDECDKLHPSIIKELSQRDNSTEDKECCLCHQMILENNRKFALLQRCDHIFCQKCVKENWDNWKGPRPNSTLLKNTRECPQCHNFTFMVIISEVYYPQSFSKSLLIYEHKHYLRRIPCRKFHSDKSKCSEEDYCPFKH